MKKCWFLGHVMLKYPVFKEIEVSNSVKAGVTDRVPRLTLWDRDACELCCASHDQSYYGSPPFFPFYSYVHTPKTLSSGRSVTATLPMW